VSYTSVIRCFWFNRTSVSMRNLMASSCGASGFAVFVPLVADIAFGAAFTTYRMTHTQRATQFVVGLRFRF